MNKTPKKDTYRMSKMPPKNKPVMDKASSIQKFKPGTIKRLLSYMGDYKLQIVIVVICILLSAVASAASSLFIQTLIDDYITPLLGNSNPVFTGLLKMIFVMAVVFLIGVLSSLFYNRLMVVVAQGTLKKIRDKMFDHMQTLPIKYFDTHTHGDVMSHYTNDTDTLRQMISQSLPQLFSSVVSILAVFVSMLYLSVGLTVLVVLFVFVLMRVIRWLVGKSGSFFMQQQDSLGNINGYIEEMIHGQKVVKVFCHEKRRKKYSIGRMRNSATALPRRINMAMS